MEACRSGPESINVLQPCYLGVLFHACAAAIFTVLFLLDARKARLHRDIFYNLHDFASFLCSRFPSAPSLCRAEADSYCNLLYLYARLEPKSFYSSISCSAGHLTCFSSKTKLLRALPFPLSPSSSSSVVLCGDARLPWSACWIISSDRGYNRPNHQPPRFPSPRLRVEPSPVF